MLFTNCQFIEGLDLSPVVPAMDIDLEMALQTGIIPGDGVTPEYNGIEETESVIGRVRDNFDAIEHQRSLNHAMNLYRDNIAAAAAANTVESTEKSAE